MSDPGVPVACTLTPQGLTTRVAEFEALFAAALTRMEREPLVLRLWLAADSAREREIRDLLAREKQCCAFLGFAISRTATGLLVEVTAPHGAGATLDTFQQAAESRRAS